MSDYERRERAVTTVEYVIPADPKWGACWNQVQQAINAAVYEFRGVGPSEPWVDPADNVIRVFANGDEIIVSFEKEADA